MWQQLASRVLGPEGVKTPDEDEDEALAMEAVAVTEPRGTTPGAASTSLRAEMLCAHPPGHSESGYAHQLMQNNPGCGHSTLKVRLQQLMQSTPGCRHVDVGWPGERATLKTSGRKCGLRGGDLRELVCRFGAPGEAPGRHSVSTSLLKRGGGKVD